MINPFKTSDLAAAHRRDLLEEAQIARLAKAGRTNHSGLGSRMLNSVQSVVFVLRRHVSGRMGTAEAGDATPTGVIFGDR